MSTHDDSFDKIYEDILSDAAQFGWPDSKTNAWINEFTRLGHRIDNAQTDTEINAAKLEGVNLVRQYLEMVEPYFTGRQLS